MSAFHEGNYRALRAYLLTMPRFRWSAPNQETESDEGCVACACLRVEGRQGYIDSEPADIERVIGCSADEADRLYWVRASSFGITGSPFDARTAVACLDVVAACYGVTPQSSATQVRDGCGSVDADCGQQMHDPSNVGVSREAVKPEDSSAIRDVGNGTSVVHDGSIPSSRHDSSEAEAAYLAELRAFASEVTA